MKILGVHGVHNFRDSPSVAADLADIWAGALARHSDGNPAWLRREDVAVAYYADLLRRRGVQGQDDLESLDDFELGQVARWLDACGLPTGTAAGRATAPLRQGLAWLAESRGLGQRAVESFVAHFFREAATYLRTPARETVRARLAETTAAHRPTVMIAHSLGSVVAYETLWKYPELSVDLLVTLGSPLALPHAVFPRLQPAPVDAKGRRPPNVRKWVNLADPGDLVAIPPGGIKNCFDGVEEPQGHPIHGFHFHKVVDYLSTTQLHAVLQRYA